MKADVDSIPGVLSPRQTRKAATRRRVLDAARVLFDTEGYVETTIRMIARRAEVSVGSVFTGFVSKGDILSQVMEERLDRLYAEFARTIPHLRGDVAERLKAIYAAGFTFEAACLKLFLAHVASAYDWTLPDDARPFGRTSRVRGIIHECLEDGQTRGEVADDADIDEIVVLLTGAYAWCYRLAAWEGAGAPEMTQAMNRQVDLIAKGFAPRP
jgi:AcrR family transcriptional regulator